MMDPVVRAVDVGRGSTKFVAQVKEDGTPLCEMFPSQAHPSETPREHDAWGAKRKTVVVPIDGLYYEVGPDAHLAADVFTANMLQNDHYCNTPEYMALLLGAVQYMQVDHIDLLVVGLPVATFKQRRWVAMLEQKVQGEHQLNKGKCVTIARVKAVAQPSGALMYYGVAHNKVAELRKERSLIVDPGRRTFDWIVTHGMQQVEKRSHSVDRGMFDVLQSIADGISRITSSQYRDYDVIDRALRYGKKPVIFQADYDISQHLPMANKIPEQAVAEMMRYVGDAADIKNIILVGGAAFFYKKALKSAFARHTIHELKDPILANVKGFQYAGAAFVKSPGGATTAARVSVDPGQMETAEDA
ncbi:PRTRC system protein D [Janthinobacterium sp. NKUCC06_STL]|uniref:PRTRC system protein D n=1 Tax=Janthinobacterium sp. NKUCC06_STL TaxID=2842127 RepID=UPI00214B7386|nr:PRTRC system protein D [Janthinobacterium sp. NKUCC06_STL]